MIHRAYKTELDPNDRQRTALLRHAGAARWAYNFGLRRKVDAFEAAWGVPCDLDGGALMETETSKVKVRTGPVNPYYLRLRPRRLTFRQRLRILFGGTLTTFVEMDSDGAGPYRAQGYLHGATVGVELAGSDDWESLAPGGLLSPSQAERFLEALAGESDMTAERMILDAIQTSAGDS